MSKAAKELQAELVEHVATYVKSDRWREALEVSARFHHYSFRNRMLIHLQLPGASFVGGYRKWQEQGRQVRKGQKGIRILAPCVYKAKDEDTDEETRILRGFRLVSVFDVSQTDGRELPSAVSLLHGMAPSGVWDALASEVERQGYTVERGPCQGANGLTDYMARKVIVRADVEEAQAVKTLAHELAHILLEHETREATREQKELEAESVAYLVMASVGIDSASYTFGYLATWANGDAARLLEIGDRAVKVAERISAVLAPEEVEEAA